MEQTGPLLAYRLGRRDQATNRTTTKEEGVESKQTDFLAVWTGATVVRLPELALIEHREARMDSGKVLIDKHIDGFLVGETKAAVRGQTRNVVERKRGQRSRIDKWAFDRLISLFCWE